MKARLNQLGIVALAVLVVRLLSLPFYPLMDTTESRYGNMARIMAETDNWLTPMFDYGVPFWGKPPLHTWASAAGIELFGVNEFAVRLPHFITGLLVLWLTAIFARRINIRAGLAVMVLATTVMFIVASGAVMTDILLTLGMTLAMVGFYRGWHGETRWSYFGFLGLAIGLLAKGPLIIVLVGLALLPWLVWQFGLVAGVVQLWQRIPLVTGLGLMLAMAAPWYVLAEQATPGFLEYFIVGEHFLRFVDSGWLGDLYGSAHDQPRGTIWLYFFAAAMPWTPVLLALAWRKVRGGARSCSSEVAFLLCWMLAPLWLFTFAGNILPAYVLPGIPALALLVVAASDKTDERWLVKMGALTPAILIVALAVLAVKTGPERSDKQLLADTDLSRPLYYWEKRTFSGQFYRYGAAQHLQNLQQLESLASVVEPYYLVVRKRRMSALPSWAQQRCVVAAKNKKRTLLQCNG